MRLERGGIATEMMTDGRELVAHQALHAATSSVRHAPHWLQKMKPASFLYASNSSGSELPPTLWINAPQSSALHVFLAEPRRQSMRAGRPRAHAAP